MIKCPDNVIAMAIKFNDLSDGGIRSALMQSKRPTLIRNPDPDSVSMVSYSNGKMRLLIMNSADPKSVNVNRSEKGMHFIFSESPFSISYSNEKTTKARMEGINAVAIPGQTSYSVDFKGTVYFGRIAQESAQACSLSAPVSFTAYNINHQLPKHGYNKLVVPRNINGEINASGGERLDKQEPKYLILGPDNQEFSVGNSMSPQDFHIHSILVESYTTFSGMTLHYAINGGMDSIKMGKGDTVVIPSGVFHYAEMHGTEPTFVMKASSESIADKFTILNGKGIAEIILSVPLLTAQLQQK